MSQKLKTENQNINVINDQFVKKMKSLESEVIVNCNDTTSLQILQNRYYKNGKLVKTEKLNKILIISVNIYLRNKINVTKLGVVLNIQKKKRKMCYK